MRKYELIAIIIMNLLFPLKGQAQWSIKNNLLYDAALSFNAGAEYRLQPQWTVALNVGYSPFETGTNTTRRWRHVLVMPEMRYWFCEAYAGHFLSVNTVYSHYNAAKLDLPLYGTKDKRYQGDFVGVGASWGYAIPFGHNNHWNIEFEVGADLAYTWYDKYDCAHCGEKLGSDHKFFVLPKLAINLAWVLPGKYYNKERAHACEEDLFFENIPWIAPDPVRPRPNLLTCKVETQRPENPYKADRPYVYFPLDKTILRRDFRDNGAVLDRIERTTRRILADTIHRVQTLQITGLASIEGPEKHNCELGEGRARALMNYLQQRVPAPEGIYEIQNGCEAWDEFREQVNNLRLLKNGEKVEVEPESPAEATLKAITPEVLASISTKEIMDLLDIIDNEPDPAQREARIKRMNGGSTFRYLKQYILANQRNSAYIRVFYEPVPDKAADAINAAVDLCQQERFEEALALLQPYAADPRAQNTLGVALYMTDHIEEAIAAFRRGAEAGSQEAVRNLKEVEKVDN